MGGGGGWGGGGEKIHKQKTNMFALIFQITIYASTNEDSERGPCWMRAGEDGGRFMLRKRTKKKKGGVGIDGSVSVTFTRMSSALGWLKPFCAGAKKEEGEKKKDVFGFKKKCQGTRV